MSDLNLMTKADAVAHLAALIEADTEDVAHQALDDAVLSTKTNEASTLNNQGAQAQLEYLLEENQDGLISAEEVVYYEEVLRGEREP